MARKYKALLTIIDQFTRFSVVVPLATESAESIYEALMIRWISVFGPPRIILVDQLRANREKVGQHVAEMCDCKVIASSTHHSRGLAVTERNHGTNTNTLAKYLQENEFSETLVNLATLAVNSTFNESIGTSPVHAFLGQVPAYALEMLIRPLAPDALMPAKGKYVNKLELELTQLRCFIRDNLDKHMKYRKGSVSLRGQLLL